MRHKHLTREQERRVIEKYRNTTDMNKRREIEDFILTSHNNFIVGLAKKHATMGVEFDDIVAEARRGALKALRDYDPNGHDNAKFITYAAFWMRHYISELTYSHGTMRVPVARAKKIHRVLKLSGSVKPDLSDCKDGLFKDDADVDALNAMFSPIRQSGNSGGDDDFDPFDVIADGCCFEQDYVEDEMRTKVMSAIKGCLTPERYEIISDTFMLDHQECEVRLKDLSRKFKCPVDYVRRQRAAAIKDLRRDDSLNDIYEEYFSKDFYNGLRRRL